MSSPSADAEPQQRALPHAAGLEARAFAPASIGNIGVGFDLLGHAIEGPRDVAIVRRIDAPALVAANAVIGADGKRAPLSRDALYPFALQGEAVASGSLHGDNVAPMLLGGVVLATHDRMIPLPAPDWLFCVVVHPDQVLETRRARAALSEPYPLSQFVEQSAHLALFLIGLQRGDMQLIRDGLNDTLVEPRRSALIPGFADVKHAALAHDALGASISGAGPSVFAWFGSKEKAEAAAPAMRAAFVAAGYDARAYVSPVAAKRAEVLA